MAKAFSNSDAIDQLNSFLRGELSAVESYRIALEKLGTTAHRATLIQCSRSHEDRARLLTQAIITRGGEPVKSSGAWGAFARLVESGAATFGEKSAIAALEEGEDHGRNGYVCDLDELDPTARQLVVSLLQSEQQRTHDMLSDMNRKMAS